MLSERDSTALLIIDMQNDFVQPTGALSVPNAIEIIPIIQKLIKMTDKHRHVFLTQDWHPPDHCSFAHTKNGSWPPHCIAGTQGAAIVPEIHNVLGNYTMIRKASSIDVDSYSPFRDCSGKIIPEVDEMFVDSFVTKFIVCGVATDYCVKETVLDALALGFDVAVVVNAIQGVNKNPNDVYDAIHSMRKAGAEIVASDLL